MPKKTPEMERYEKETGKKAIWREEITEGFKKWLEGEKIYGIDKKIIGISVSDKKKEIWEKFANSKGFPTISKFVREAISHYIESYDSKELIDSISKLSHDLKEPLTTIQGFSKLIIENDSDKLNTDILFKIKEIYSQSLLLENKIKELLNDIEPEKAYYDILIIEDIAPTITVLESYFESKGISCKGVTTGTQGLKELRLYKPKLILLDIILPDIDGYEICKKIKSDNNLHNIPIFYVTAVPESEVRKKLEETGADGYFLKPFKFDKFEVLLDYL
ncbi:MAG: response regulator [Promethearchaeota archaeon]